MKPSRLLVRTDVALARLADGGKRCLIDPRDCLPSWDEFRNGLASEGGRELAESV